MQIDYKPTIAAFCCNWCSYAGADLAGSSRLQYPAEVKVIKVPCSCRVDPMFILRAFQKGADGVIICGCHPGDCHYVEGNYKTMRRFPLLKALLKEMGVEDERVRLEWVSASEGQRFSEVINDMTDKIRALGPSKIRTQLEADKVER